MSDKDSGWWLKNAFALSDEPETKEDSRTEELLDQGCKKVVGWWRIPMVRLVVYSALLWYPMLPVADGLFDAKNVPFAATLLCPIPAIIWVWRRPIFGKANAAAKWANDAADQDGERGDS